MIHNNTLEPTMSSCLMLHETRHTSTTSFLCGGNNMSLSLVLNKLPHISIDRPCGLHQRGNCSFCTSALEGQIHQPAWGDDGNSFTPRARCISHLLCCERHSYRRPLVAKIDWRFEHVLGQQLLDDPAAVDAGLGSYRVRELSLIHI